MLVPNEDASKSRSYRVAPWQIGVVILGLVALISAVTVAVLFYTPITYVLPISNPELENKYNKELVELNTKVAVLMEELLNLRAYNVKLRNAFGENVSLTDSGVVKVGAAKPTPKSSISEPPPQIAELDNLPGSADRIPSSAYERASLPESLPDRVSFPAILPTEGYVTRGYEAGGRHLGLDIAGKIGAPVVAAADGNVVFAGWTYEDGYLMILSHANGFMTIYKHNQSLLKSTNAYVKRGDLIATLGNSGITSSGPHLHFEIWKDGVPAEPTHFILNLFL